MVGTTGLEPATSAVTANQKPVTHWNQGERMLRKDIDAFDLLRAAVGVSYVGSGGNRQQRARKLVRPLPGKSGQSFPGTLKREPAQIVVTHC
jgi:hypothetical protein